MPQAATTQHSPKPAKIYAYAVSAVDSTGNESVPSPAAIWMFRGKSNCGGSDLSYGGTTAKLLRQGGRTGQRAV